MRNPETKRFSWYRTKPQLTASRLDIALVSQGIADMVKNITYFTGVQTDHSAISLTVQQSQTERGAGFWKLNSLLLSDINFVRRINELIDRRLIELEEAHPHEKWERLKISMQ